MTRPHIAILGAGPTGLEAALAAVDHGFPFTLYESSDAVAGHVRAWGHVRLFSPWSMNVSPRMRRHLELANLPVPAADDDTCPTGAELIDRILEPVASLRAVAPHIRTGVTVKRVGRTGLLKHEAIASDERAGRSFRLLLEAGGGPEETAEADVVIDCTGTYSNPNALGDGGIPAPGEAAAADSIWRHLPNFLAEPDEWADRSILLVGAGHSAQTAAVDLARLAAAHPDTTICWALRRPDPSWPTVDNDALPERSRLVAAATAIAVDPDSPVETITGVVVDSLATRGDKTEVCLRHDSGQRSTLLVDRIVALTGAVGDDSIYRQLQVHECYATSGPMKLAAALLGSSTADCLAQESHGVETLLNPEPNFFILGSKSYGRTTTFLMRVGWQQVADVFGVLSS